MGETSTRTRDMLRIADDKLAKMKTSTRTREELKKVEERQMYRCRPIIFMSINPY